ncbi:MAG: hypothetical protein ACFFCZ_14880 [Promethearchaeota archaeon]
MRKYLISRDGELLEVSGTSYDHFDNKEVYIIVDDTLKRIFIWNGQSASASKMFLASRAASDLKVNQLRTYIITPIDHGVEIQEFLDSFNEKPLEKKRVVGTNPEAREAAMKRDRIVIEREIDEELNRRTVNKTNRQTQEKHKSTPSILMDLSQQPFQKKSIKQVQETKNQRSSQATAQMYQQTSFIQNQETPPPKRQYDTDRKTRIALEWVVSGLDRRDPDVREELFKRIIQRVDKVELHEMVSLLKIDKYDLVDWIFRLPDRYGLTLKGDIVIIDNTSTIKYIDEILNEFYKLEQSLGLKL